MFQRVVNNNHTSCCDRGCAVLNNEVFVYYGAADTYVCVATVELDELLSELTSKRFYID